MATEVANSSVTIAMAFAGRSARACDVCASKGAHWFCAADDAYLCTACDTQVHSANALSLRHERVRLSATGTPMKSSSSKTFSKVPKVEEPSCNHVTKKLHPSPPQVAPFRKRSRTSRPYSQHLKKLTQVVKSEVHHSSELELFDFLDAGEELLLHDGNQEVPCLSTVVPVSSPCESSELDFLSPDCEFQEGDHSASADSFAVFFKSKAAHDSHAALDDGDQFLVPDGFLAPAPASSDDDLPSDAFFFPGDIPGLDCSFVPEMDLSDDFSLSFDLALRNNNGVEAFEGDGGIVSQANLVTCKVEESCHSQPDQNFTAGPFAKFFATKTKAELMMPLSPDRIASQAKEMLKSCEDDDVQRVPSLQLNLKDVLTAWSERGDVWINTVAEDSNSSGTSSDVGIVPDMDKGDDGQSGADRDARVLRYKEKRRTRLYSKKIRYEVRKLNAERRPRMKGRFVKRTTTTS